ncbi:hypothetical protein K491DRAFT_772651 [Lophiostoma macrostomum CBS 122681]|uniref:Uncharacterized protein n=1 Tax=Lophiostoma macrostomum CBS 122681 TaxID=1314788 RepID=A0A6A6TTW5_9PLEO|nr:hypothetical protein K491DRAFT_772651 [Lophiostoma macrostomum CBS 122681]
MCYYRLYVFLGCGHAIMEDRPLKRCKEVMKRRGIERVENEDESTRETEIAKGESAQSQGPAPLTGEECTPSEAPDAAKRNESEDQDGYTCQARLTHPIQTIRIYQDCLFCARARAQRLHYVEEMESGNEVRFEDWRWKVKYHSPVPEESKYMQQDWGSPGEWSEAMGSWVQGVKGKASGLGLGDLGGGIWGALKETGSEVVKDGLKRDRVKDEGAMRVGSRGNIPSS